MSTDRGLLIKTLAAGGPRGAALADAITGLIVEGAELGELQEVVIRNPDGQPRTVRTMPPEWLDRLTRAIDVGAFERMSAQQIVARILLPPLPESGASSVASRVP